ncbi:putative peptidylprolyl isomerase [Lupinus albus]|uniref:peptidylprolyl isomerase n=1 Tax=Lupinus albus TaxID=3870 RepID=A0A6A4Q9G0_LUPAL|nr:putative peptidylprolyl isomerase [Lupinus albus]
MSSLAPYSLWTSLQHKKASNYSAPKSSNLVLCNYHYHHHKTSSASQSLVLLQNDETNPIKRRDALAFSLSFGLLHAFFYPQQSLAAVEEVPCQLTVAPSGLSFCDKVVGTGSQAVKGQLIKAHYVGRLENGKVFDSSYNRGTPLTFRVGIGEVIKGWDEGILGGDGVPPMLAGGKRTLKLPPELAYGSRGAGCKGGSCVIPPDSVLLFDVEFVSKA